jgi:FtsP/CotA-like multicopper oxidase with cupredoxin domain
MTRRDLLRLIGAGATAGVAPFDILRSRGARDAQGAPGAAAVAPDVELTLRASPGEARIFPGRPTDVWRFTGAVTKGPAEALQPMPDSYLGPTLRFRRGQRVRVRFTNGLTEPTIVHWHGLDVPEEADGHPRFAIDPGREYIYDFQVTNRAGTYWYHPHPHHLTGKQVYRGLAGLLIVSDDEERALGLPSGDQELLCVLQDRRVDANNQFTYLGAGMMDQMHGLLGDRVLVNGRLAPVASVATRGYRLRLLNGSSSRVYKLEWSDGTPLTIVGSQGGLLERPRDQRYLLLAPAQRADVFVDLGGRAVGTSIELRTAAFAARDVDRTAGGMAGGMGRGMGRMGMGGAAASVSPAANGAPHSLMTLRVDRKETSSYRLPERLSTFGPAWAVRADAPVRPVTLSFAPGQWLLDGRTFDLTATAPEEEVRAGSTQIWEVTNVSGMMGVPMAHPLHIHGRPFRILSREPMPGTDAGAPSVRDGLLDEGWTDTVLILPNEKVRLQVTFSEHPGLYLYHCHILEHEDMGMMRNLRLLAR